ncbi:MAG: hypothetical protein P4L57_01370 [Rhizomicrobium sp.]|nr:hypothetical protein [Rhizomicrobium sp.]
MRVPSAACCVGTPDREEPPIETNALLIITAIYGAIGFFAYAVALFYA